jgi:dinuclear metal center YbgI/SA1388 family protein
MKIKEVIHALEAWAPKAYQESYDNCGIQAGNAEQELKGILITLDTTEEIIDEAINTKCNLIIAHHPLLFKGLKSITGKNDIERAVIKAIKNDITVYAIHTNLDHASTGVSHHMAQRLGLLHTSTLLGKTGLLSKLITYVPEAQKEVVLEALFSAGAGEIGKYSACAFRSEGIGSFMPQEHAQPHVGEINRLEYVNETKIETIFPTHIQHKVVQALKKAHPYEEVAYDLIALQNTWESVGSGMIGTLPQPMAAHDFLSYLAQKMNVDTFKYTQGFTGTIHKVAVCGGAGSFLLKNALQSGAQAFVSADFKYHEFFDAENNILVADIGHYESEVYTKELIYGFLIEKFTNIAILISEINTNPVRYFRQ